MNASDGKSQSKKTTSTREQLLDAAEMLFYREGVRATGVEAVAHTAGVAKISLYRSFDTKDDLVVAYLDRRRVAYWRQWDKLVQMHDDSRDRLLAFIDYLADRTTTPQYRGCPFTNCAIEFPDPESPAHQAAVAMKQEVRNRLRELCLPLSPDPEQLADELVLLIEGAYASAHTLDGRDGPARLLPRAARSILQASAA